MQQANEAAILDHVRRNGSLSRSDVSRDLGLSGATVSRAVRRLLHAGALREVGVGMPSLGRPPTLLEYNRRQGFVVAVDVGGTSCRTALADLEGDILYADAVPTHQAGREVVDIVCEAIDTARRQARDLSSQVTALAVAAPGIVAESGTVSRAPNVGWEGVRVGRLLQERFRIPVIVENDVNLAALGEAWRGAAQGIASFVVVSMGTGIGAGIVVGGELLYGCHNAAGEVGYLVPGNQYLSRPRSQGWFEALASGPGLAARASELLNGSSAAGDETEADCIQTENVFQLYRSGDEMAHVVINELIDHVALLITSLSVILDPEVIIFGGSVGVAMQEILSDVAGRVEGLIPALPRLTTSTLEGRATLLGAISAALALSRAAESAPAGLAAHQITDTDASMALAVRSIKAGG